MSAENGRWEEAKVAVTKVVRLALKSPPRIWSDGKVSLSRVRLRLLLWRERVSA